MIFGGASELFLSGRATVSRLAKCSDGIRPHLRLLLNAAFAHMNAVKPIVVTDTIRIGT